LIYAGEQVQLTRIDDNGKKSASLSTLPGIFSRVIDRSQIKFQRFEGAARMATRNIGIVIDGATGRLGTTQHLRSLMAIRRDGGLVLANGDRLVPEPVLLGRNPAKLAVLATANGDVKWSTDRDICLADPGIAIYFDANATGGRSARAGAALAAGNTCISKNRSPKPSRMHWISRVTPSAPVRKPVSCRTNCSCPGLRSCASVARCPFLHFGNLVAQHPTSEHGIGHHCHAKFLAGVDLALRVTLQSNPRLLPNDAHSRIDAIGRPCRSGAVRGRFYPPQLP
jgi:hypothetical protein